MSVRLGIDPYVNRLEGRDTEQGCLLGNHTDTGSPFGKFAQPIHYGREGHNDKVRTTLFLSFNEERDQRDGLNRFAKTLQKYQLEL